jgi:hypothetical protein
MGFDIVSSSFYGEAGRVALDPVRGSHEISVQLDAMETFARTVESIVERHQPSLDHLTNAFSSGVPFGRSSPAGDVRVASTAYASAASAMTTQFTQLGRGTQALADAIRTIAARYRSADELRAADPTFVSVTVSEALTRDMLPASLCRGASRTQAL